MICLDFETKDPYIGLGLNGGWVYEHHLKTGKFFVIGWSICPIVDGLVGESTYTIGSDNTEKEKQELFTIIDSHNELVMHNAAYDLGCLVQLGYSIEKLKTKTIYDTKIMAKLYNNQSVQYSLDTLANMYLPEQFRKKKNALVEIVQKHKLLKTKGGKDKKEDASNYAKAAETFGYENMDLLQAKEPGLMAYYANQDTTATAHLFLFYRGKLKNDELSAYYSYLDFIFNVDLRRKGLRVSIPAIQKAMEVLAPEVESFKKIIFDTLKLPKDFNLESPMLAKIVGKAGYPLPRTATGAMSLTSTWIEQYDGKDELLLAIKGYRATHKLYRDFCQTILTNLAHTCPDALHGQDFGYVYPVINVLQAKTGRASSSGPNVQQIPNAEKSRFGKLIRQIYLPEPGKEWVSADWSNQEGRWQVHYGSPHGSQELVDRFIAEPNMDLHSEIAQILFEYNKDNVDKEEHKRKRKLCKGINLGLSYGMGIVKLSNQLGMTQDKAAVLKSMYNEKFPFLHNLGKAIEGALKQRGYIKFFDGRVFRRESAIVEGKRVYYDYKGINALMQGSGASQMYLAVYKAYKAGMDILFPVHDEINIQVLQEDLQTQEQLRAIMEDTKDIKCRVPMLVEIKRGNSWGDTE